MSTCPLCNAPVTDDFGLTECSGCGAQLLVHMDGRVVYSGAEEAKSAEEIAETAAHDENATRVVGGVEPGTHFAFEQPKEFEYQSAVKEDPEPVAPEEEPTQLPPPLPPQDDEFGANFDFGSLTPPEEDEPPTREPTRTKTQAPADMPEPAEAEADVVDSEPPPPPVDEIPDFLADEPPPPEEAPVVKAPEDISDIAQFGNSDLSAARDGSLRYNLFVSGIDTVDVRENFREAITDRKLLWDTDEILRAIRDGEVRIAGVSAAKAHIVVNRLRELPVKVRWEQYALAQT